MVDFLFDGDSLLVSRSSGLIWKYDKTSGTEGISASLTV